VNTFSVLGLHEGHREAERAVGCQVCGGEETRTFEGLLLVAELLLLLVEALRLYELLSLDL